MTAAAIRGEDVSERESELRWGQHIREMDQRWEAHREVHKVGTTELDRRFAEINMAVDRAFGEHRREHGVHEANHLREHTASESAITKSENAMTARFASVNEFRQTLTDQARTFATTERIDALLSAATQRNELLTKDIDRRFLEQGKLIDTERTARIRAESSLGTIRAVALFLGPVGIAGVVLGLIAVFGPQ